MSQFGHETLNVYQESIRFITWISELLGTIQKNLSVHNQLERASLDLNLDLDHDLNLACLQLRCLPGCSCCQKEN